MKRNLFAIIAALCAAFCLCFGLAACNNDDSTPESGKVTYTVTVNCPESDTTTPITLTVKLTTEAGADATEAVHLTDGKATFSLDAGKYKVVLADYPPTYTYTDTYLTATVHSATVTLAAETPGTPPAAKVKYTVKLTLPTGAPVANTKLQLCSTKQCHDGKTGADGVAEFELAADSYEVHVAEADCPTGYLFDNTMYTVAADSRSVTAVFDAAQQYTITVVYDATKDASGTDIDQRPAEGIKVVLDRINGAETIRDYKEVTTGADGTVKFNAAKADYWVRLNNCPVTHSYQTLMIESVSPVMTVVLIERGTNEYNPIIVRENEEITVTVNAKATEYWYRFDCRDKTGKYKLESSKAGESGNIDTYCTRYAGDAASIILNPLNTADEYSTYSDDKAADDKNFTMTFGIIPSEHTEHSVYIFRIGANVESSALPQTFKFKFTFVEEIHEIFLDTTTPHAEQLIAAEDQPAVPGDSKFVWLDLHGDDVVFCEADGLYHRNAENGPVIFVPVGGKTYYPRALGGKNFLGAYQEANGIGFVLSDGKTFKYDYSQFLIDYAGSSNSVGLHPLTEELKFFLQQYAQSSTVPAALGWDYKINATEYDPNLYYFACGYFTSAYIETVGEGTQDEPYILGLAGDYRLTVPGGSSAYLFVYMRGGFDEEYKLTVTSGRVKLYDSEDVEAANGKLIVANGTTAVIKNSGTTAVTAVLTLKRATVEGNITATGSYAVDATHSGRKYKFIAPEAGVYIFSTDDSGASLCVYNDELKDLDDIPDAVTLSEGEEFSFYCCTAIDGEEAVYTVEIVMATNLLTVGSNLGLSASAEGTEHIFVASAVGEYTFSFNDTLIEASIALNSGAELIQSGYTVTLGPGRAVRFTCYPADFEKDSETFAMTVTKTELE